MFETLIEQAVPIILLLVTGVLGWIVKNRGSELLSVKGWLDKAEGISTDVSLLIEEVNDALEDDKISEAEFKLIFKRLKRFSEYKL